MSPLSRILALATRPGVEPGHRANLRWFRLFMLLHVAGRSLLTLNTESIEHGAHAFVLYAQITCCLLGFLPWNHMRMARLSTLLLVAQIAITFPLTANHVYLECLWMALLSLLDESVDTERELLMQAIRWFTAIFFFYSGLQKVLYGRYFDGQFLGHVVATEARFREFFQLLMPAEEVDRLRRYGAAGAGPGTGPYRVDAPLFVAVSNLVYVFEMAAPALLIVRRTRVVAALAAVLFVVAIEAGAREFVFGALMVNLLLLFLPPAWNKWLFPLFAAGYLYLVAASFGFVPGFYVAL